MSELMMLMTTTYSAVQAVALVGTGAFADS